MPNGIYHLGSLYNNSFDDIAECIGGSIEYIKPSDKLLKQYQYRTESNISRLLAAIDFNPKALREGVKNYCEWLNSNRDLMHKYMDGTKFYDA